MTTRLDDDGIQFVDGNRQLYPAFGVRQTVTNGPVDSNGLATFGGSTGGTTVTAAGTLELNAANGNTTRRGSITNPSWTGLNTNGTMFLYLDIAADNLGTCTPGSTTLAPVYQPGGTFSTVNGQFTFNYGVMSGQVGNGSTATQVYRVFIGEVTVASNLVTAIVWYATNGYNVSADVAVPAVSGAVNFVHNIGMIGAKSTVFVRCNTTSGAGVAGQVFTNVASGSGAAYAPYQPKQTSRISTSILAGNNTALSLYDTGGAFNAQVTANFTFYLVSERPFK